MNLSEQVDHTLPETGVGGVPVTMHWRWHLWWCHEAFDVLLRKYIFAVLVLPLLVKNCFVP